MQHEWRDVTPDGHPVEGLVVESPVVVPVEDAVPDDSAVDYGPMTKLQLVARINALNEGRAADDKLSTVGSKVDLAQRIQDAETTDVQDESPPDEVTT
jgi:hypothetical protein